MADDPCTVITVPWPEQVYEHDRTEGLTPCWAVYPDPVCRCGAVRLSWAWTTQAQGTPDPELTQARRIEAGVEPS